MTNQPLSHYAHRGRRILAILLAFLMIFALAPTIGAGGAFAAYAGESGDILGDKIDEAKALTNDSEYAEATWTALQKAIESAEDLHALKNPAQEDTDGQVALLDAAITAAVKNDDLGKYLGVGEHSLEGKVTLRHYSNPLQNSMGHGAIIQADSKLIVNGDGTAEVRLAFQSLTVQAMGLTSYLLRIGRAENMVFEDNGYVVKSYDVVPATVYSVYEGVTDAFGPPEGQSYPRENGMPVTLGEDLTEFIVQVFVPIMDAISPGSGTQLARIEIDWDSLGDYTFEPADLTALSSAIDQAKAVDTDGYVEKSAAALTAAIASGEWLVSKTADTTVTQTMVDNQAVLIAAAVAALVAPQVISLDEKIAEAKALVDDEDYTEETRAALQTVIEAAEDALASEVVASGSGSSLALLSIVPLADEGLLQEEIDRQIALIDAAIAALIKIEDLGKYLGVGEHSLDGKVAIVRFDDGVSSTTGTAAIDSAGSKLIVNGDGSAEVSLALKPFTFAMQSVYLDYIVRMENVVFDSTYPWVVDSYSLGAETVYSVYEGATDFAGPPEGGSYPKEIGIPIVLGETIQTLMVEVYQPTMDALGSGHVIARLEIDWDSLGDYAFTPADLTALNSAIDQAKAVDTDGYTEKSAAALAAVIASSEWLVDKTADTTVTQAMVNNQTALIAAAVDALVVPSEAPADKAALTSAVADANHVDVALYAEPAQEAYAEAIAAAQAVIEDDEAEQEEIDEQVDALAAALAELKANAIPPTRTATATAAALHSVNEALSMMAPLLDPDAIVEEIGGYSYATITFKNAYLMGQPINVAVIHDVRTFFGESGETEVWATDVSSSDGVYTVKVRVETGVANTALKMKAMGQSDSAIRLNLTDIVWDGVDKTELEEAVTDAEEFLEGLAEEDYTASSFAALSSAIEAAVDVVEDAVATQGEVDEALAGLAAARANLAARASASSIANLNVMIELWDDFTADGYTAESWEAFQDALDAAKDLIAEGDDEISAAAAAAAYDDLFAAFAGLTTEVDKSNLADFIAIAEKVIEDEALYIPSAIADLKVELAAAKALMSKTDATQTEITDAYKSLMTALWYTLDKGDKSKLASLVAIADLYVQSAYTPNSWTGFATALADARVVNADPDAIDSEIEPAYDDLRAAMNALVRIANKVSLGDAIALADAILADSDAYAPGSITDIAPALAAARTVYDDANATQTQVNDARTALNNALGKARFKAKKEALIQTLSQIQTLDLTLYEAEGVTNLNLVINAANLIIADENATQAAVDTAVTNLLTANSALVEKGTTGGGSAGGTGDSGGAVIGGGSNNGGGQNGTGSQGDTGSQGNVGSQGNTGAGVTNSGSNSSSGGAFTPTPSGPSGAAATGGSVGGSVADENATGSGITGVAENGADANSPLSTIEDEASPLSPAQAGAADAQSSGAGTALIIAIAALIALVAAAFVLYTRRHSHRRRSER